MGRSGRGRAAPFQRYRRRFLRSLCGGNGRIGGLGGLEEGLVRWRGVFPGVVGMGGVASWRMGTNKCSRKEGTWT